MNASQSHTVLVVEDESAIREMLHFSLVRAGFEVLEAADARQAQDTISNTLPDLILLDWMLPGTSGIDLARKFRQHTRTRELPKEVLVKKKP